MANLTDNLSEPKGERQVAPNLMEAGEKPATRGQSSTLHRELVDLPAKQRMNTKTLLV